ncbi:phosphoadenosine phosphosulfate reductase family protein [Methylococcus sp. ANG]|uniref:phosphoadenosine phosphosulfate reductase domain-containing protein n=1 Tax=Methylococcus sp. ANG TaxID=3231903 RepID=UPI00345A2CC8
MTPQQIVAEALSRHDRAVVSFSGGKDSVAVLHACRGYEDRVLVMFVDLDDIPQHVRDYVYNLCEMWGFQLTVVDPPTPIREYHARVGLPADIVPIWSTPFADGFLAEEDRPATRLISGLECCARNLWVPMRQAVEDSGTTLLFRGSKKSDAHVSVTSGTRDGRVEIVNPLWDMTDLDVYNHLAAHGVVLPRHYREGLNTSWDCLRCTAWLNTPSEVERLEFTKRYYPEAYADLQIRTQLIWDEIGRRSEELVPALKALSDAAPESFR